MPASARCGNLAPLSQLFATPVSIDRETVLKIAHLARIDLAVEDAGSMVGELARILDLVAQMDAVDTAGVEPMAHPLEMVQRLRDDTVTEPDKRDHFQQYAPATDQGLYLVPRVIE